MTKARQRSLQGTRKEREETKARISREMRRLGAHSTHDLRRIAADGKLDTESRAQACFLLGQIGDREAACTMLRIATAGADDQVTWEAFNALGMIGNRAITPSLLDLLSQTTEPTRRQQIVYALWFLADRRSIPTLLRLLADVEEDDSVRGYAAEGLGSHRHTTEILEALAAALSDSSVNVRVSALCALSGAHRVVPKENRNVFQMKVVPAVIGRLPDQEGCQGEETIAEMARSLLDAWNLPVPDAYGAP